MSRTRSAMQEKKIFPSGHSRDMGIRNISLSGISEIALGKGLLRARGASVPFGSSCFGSVQDSVCSLPILDLFWSRKESVPTYNFFSHGLIWQEFFPLFLTSGIESGECGWFLVVCRQESVPGRLTLYPLFSFVETGVCSWLFVYSAAGRFFFSSCRARSRLRRSSKRLVVGQLFSGCKRTGEMQKAGRLQIAETETRTQTKHKKNEDIQKTKWNTTLFRTITSTEHSVPLHDDIAIPASREGPSCP